VELFSIYPTLLDLCGLPANKQIEAESIFPLVKSPGKKWDRPAITTWARNNHAIVTKDYRYIRYEDGSEELYVLKNDSDEWHNMAADEKFVSIKAGLRKWLPTRNVKWAASSRYDNNDYFIKQKREQSE
jgi:arylsulfatase A-like enzyme